MLKTIKIRKKYTERSKIHVTAHINHKLLSKYKANIIGFFSSYVCLYEKLRI